MNKWLKNIQRWPAGCLLCGETTDGRPLCGACINDLPRLDNACNVCAEPLTVSGAVCGHCQRRPPPFTRTFALFQYAPPVDFLLQRMKFNNKLPVARLMGQLLAQHVKQQTSPLPERLIPVPLHGRRLRERGYNQSLELARPLAKALGVTLDYRSCRRLHHTEAQSELPAKQRRRNIRGVFGVTQHLEATHVAIIDDVMTTGSTVSELATTLIRSGVETVEVWVCARAASSR